MMQPVNPYVAGAPLREERGFFGRQDTLDWVAQELRNLATNALVLFGQRRIGKTTLLLQLERTLPAEAFLPVYFDLQDQATRPLGQVLADLSDTVAERVGLRSLDPADFDDRGRFFRRVFLPQLYQALGEHCRPVFLLDEFDVLGQPLEARLPETVAAKALFPFLRKVMTEDSYPAFVFVVGRRAEDLSLDFSATFKASLEREVWVLDPESAEMLVRQAEVNDTLHFTDQAVPRILSLTHCHPYLTQLLCQRIWERAWTRNPTAPPLIGQPEVEAILPDVFETGNQALAWLWNGLSPAEKIYAAALAEVADEGEPIPEARIIHVLTAHAARLRRREVELAPRDLVQRRVLEQAGDKEYRFAIELFCDWVRKNKPLQEVKDELDRIEPFADRLYEIGKDYFNQSQWENAIHYFQDALGKNPRHFRARLYLGEALLELDKPSEAVAELESAYELDRDEARYTLARALVAQGRARDEVGDEDGALAACERALQVSPNEQAAQELRTAIWVRRGDTALKRDDLEKALAAYRQAGDIEKMAQVEALQQQTLIVLEAEARAHEQAERWAEAIDILGRIAHVDPIYKDANSRLDQAQVQHRLQNLYRQAQGHFREEKWNQAIGALETILQEDPDYHDAAKKLEEARKHRQFATRRDEHLADLHSAGIESLQRQSWEEAVVAFRELIRIDPGYKDAWQRLDEAKEKAKKFGDLEDLYCAGKVHFDQRQWKAAIVYLKRIVDSGETYKDAATLLEEAEKQLELQALYTRAAAWLEEERWAEAIKVLEMIVHTDPTYGDSQAQLDQAQAQYRLKELYNRALDHFREERWSQAIRDLKTILGDAPDYLDAADRLEEAQKQQKLAALYSAGVGLLETGRWEEAIDKFVEIIRWVGGYKEVANKLAQAQRQKRLDGLFKEGTVHLRRREWQEAAKKFGEVHAMDPDYRSVQARLEEAKRQLRLEELHKREEASVRTGNWREAVEVFGELRELDPGDGSTIIKLEEARRQLQLDTLYREGVSLSQEERWRKAETILGKVVHLDPDYRDAAAKLDIAREHLGRRKSVTEILRDPLWQGIGGVGAIIALIIAVYPFIKDNLHGLVKPTPTPKPPELCNGAFADNFECWQHGGELDQSVECDGDGCFAVLGNPSYKCEGGVPMGEAWIKQSFKVPDTISPTLSLRYRVFSQDLGNYDFFEVSIKGKQVGRYGNTEWDESSCDREAWDSGWRSVEFDLSPYSGERVDLSLRNVNGTHEWWNTWTYVDDVEIR